MIKTRTYVPHPIEYPKEPPNECITKRISDLPLDEQARINRLFERARPMKSNITTIGNDKTKQRRRGRVHDQA